ncbi:Phage Mu protein F like protein [compost metagenome]
MKTFDAKQPKFKTPKSAEAEYNRQLRSVAKQVGHLVKLYQVGATLMPGFDKAMAAYAETLAPWAANVAAKMLLAVSKTNYRHWKAESQKIGRELRDDHNVALGRLLQEEQVVLIKSLPLEAATRAQDLAFQAATGGRRADEVATEIARSGEVAASRATLIARTEVAKANSAITQARSAEVGATHYIWRTAEDEAVRESHAEMEGVVVAWDDPPTLSDGTTTHAGQIYNCRCYAEPIIEG